MVRKSLLFLILTICQHSALIAMKEDPFEVDIITAKIKELSFNSKKQEKSKHIVFVIPPINHKESPLYSQLKKHHNKKATITLFSASIKDFKQTPLIYTKNSLYDSDLLSQAVKLALTVIEIKHKHRSSIIHIIASKSGCLIATIASQLLNIFASFKERKDDRRKSLYFNEIEGFKRLSDKRKSDSFILRQLKQKIWNYENWHYYKGKDTIDEKFFKRLFLDAKKSIFQILTKNFTYSKESIAKRYSTGFSMSAKSDLSKIYLINTLYLCNAPQIIGDLSTKEFYLPCDVSVERCIHFWSSKNSLFKDYFGSNAIQNPSLFDLTSVKVAKPFSTRIFKNEDINDYFAHFFFTITQQLHQAVSCYYPKAILTFSTALNKEPIVTINLK